MRKRASRFELETFLHNAISSQTDECIIWPFARSHYAYGTLVWDGKQVNVHRLICAMVHGQADGFDAAHLCHNPPCCNPKHLSWMTHKENVQVRRQGKGGWRVSRKRQMSEETAKSIWMKRGLMTARQAAYEDGASIHAVRKIWLGKTWRSVTSAVSAPDTTSSASP